MAQLITIGSSSSGNAYAIDTGSEILLLEAGIKYKEVAKAIDFRIGKVVGCLLSHGHSDHSKYVRDYAFHAIKIYGNQDVFEKKYFSFNQYTVLEQGKTYNVGSFRVVPIPLHHDVPNFGYLIYHESCGTIFFALDTYKLDFDIIGIDHWLIEANYDDRILKANVQDGKIDRAQANRLMVSHMSLNNTLSYLRACQAEKSKTIVLCHLSERNSDPDLFRRAFIGAFGIPCYCATKGLVIPLNKDVI